MTGSTARVAAVSTVAVACALLLLLLLLPARPHAEGERFVVEGSDGTRLLASVVAAFDSPWALDFLPDGRLLVSQRSGGVWLVAPNGAGKVAAVDGAPQVQPRGQGGMGDVLVHPRFADDATVFLSYVAQDARDSRRSGAVVERARLTLRGDGAAFEAREVIWRQVPAVTGNGHYGHRLLLSPDGYLFVSSGERQKFTPAQDLASNLGKVLRLHQDGTAPADNPFAGQGGVAAEVWSLGHRNPLGLALDDAGRLFEVEMGPRGGDELNLVRRGANYGYPEVSEGRHYSGRDIPDHATQPRFVPPLLAWSPVISPAGLDICEGPIFAAWRGQALVAGLSARALVRVALPEAGPGDERGTARELARYGWGRRVRAVREGPDGALYVLEDGAGGRLLRLVPEAGDGEATGKGVGDE